MHFTRLGALLCLASLSFSLTFRPRDYEKYDYYALHIKSSRSTDEVAHRFGFEFEGQIGHLDDHYLFRIPKHSQNVVRDAIMEHKLKKKKRTVGYQDTLLDDILFHQKQKLKPPHEKRGFVPPRVSNEVERQAPPPGSIKEAITEAAIKKGREIAVQLQIEDPIYNDQWHLYNPIQLGHDINVTGVWLQGITGKNSYVAIVDDGLDMYSNDLKDNYYSAGSYDFNEKVNEPKPRLSDDKHGTRCAGEVSAVRNDVCGIGVAYDSKIAGLRILGAPITDADEAEAMTYGFERTQIYSCSWGPPDDGMQMGAPGILIKRAMVKAIQEGRNGAGTIYVFAAGNGAAADDNCNFDGYTNSIYSITVGAIDRNGEHPYYSEKCSAQLVVTYSSGGGDAIHTTDVGMDKCYSSHGGTSAAGPLAVGMYALVLEVRPELTWRDMQWLAVDTAIPVNQPSDWQLTPYGKNFSHQFGYGKLDAWALVEAAKTFQSKKPQSWYFSPWQHIRHKIPEGDKGLLSSFEVSQEALGSANFETLEHVTVTMNIEHTRRGDLSVELRSPSGVVSHLSTARKRDAEAAGYEDWTFMSVAHWGEDPVGTWVLIVKDLIVNEHNGTFVDWKLNLFGECVDASKQTLLPLPTEHDDDDHDREDGVAHTTSIELPVQTDEPQGNPSDHIDRPVNAKPTPSSAASTTSASQSPSQAPTSTAPPDNFLPSPFPNFGVSKKTQVWIYGSAALIVIFCVSLAVYFYLAHKKRQRNMARDNYEFEMLAEDDEENEKGANAGRKGAKAGKRRAGELYDAFAGGSDEELFSEDDDAYHDDRHDSKERFIDK